MSKVFPLLLAMLAFGCGKRPVADEDARVESGAATSGNELTPQTTLLAWREMGFANLWWSASDTGQIIFQPFHNKTPDAILAFSCYAPLKAIGPKPEVPFALDLRGFYDTANVAPAAVIQSLPTTAGDKLFGLGLAVSDPVQLAVLKDLPSLRYLALNLTPEAFSKTDWRAIAEMPNLKAVELTLTGHERTPDTVKLAVLKPLRVPVSVSGTLSWTAVKGLTEVPALTSLSLAQPSTEMLADVALAPGLCKLTVTMAEVQFMSPKAAEATRGHFAPVGKMTRLTSLHLNGGGLADEFLSVAVGLPNLTELSVSCPVSQGSMMPGGNAPKAETVAKIAALTKLRSLTLHGCSRPKDGLQFLSRSTELRILKVGGYTASLSDVTAVPGLAGRLTELGLGDYSSGEKELADFAAFQSLRRLTLTFWQLKPTFETALANLPALRELEVRSARIDEFLPPRELTDKLTLRLPLCSVNGQTPHSAMSKEELEALPNPDTKLPKGYKR